MSKSTPKLSAKQVKYLRGEAHHLKPILWMGDNGLTEAFQKAVDEALLQHELIKVRMRKPEDKKTLAQDLASCTDSTLCGLTGHTVILYRQHPEEPKVHVPKDPK